MGKRRVNWAIAACVLAAASLGIAGSASATVFTSPTGAGSGNGSAPPANLLVHGLSGTVTGVSATLGNLTVEVGGDSSDLDILLVAPQKQSSILMSDVCGPPLINQTYTFTDAAPTALTPGGCPSGTYKPSDHNDGIGDGFFAGAPLPPYVASMAAFNGTSPNGIWSVYLSDDTLNAKGGGFSAWSLNIETTGTQLQAAKKKCKKKGKRVKKVRGKFKCVKKRHHRK